MTVRLEDCHNYTYIKNALFSFSPAGYAHMKTSHIVAWGTYPDLGWVLSSRLCPLLKATVIAAREIALSPCIATGHNTGELWGVHLVRGR